MQYRFTQTILHSLTIDEKTYLTYRNNIQKLQEKVIDGEFTKSVLHQLSL